VASALVLFESWFAQKVVGAKVIMVSMQDLACLSFRIQVVCCCLKPSFPLHIFENPLQGYRLGRRCCCSREPSSAWSSHTNRALVSTGCTAAIGKLLTPVSRRANGSSHRGSPPRFEILRMNEERSFLRGVWWTSSMRGFVTARCEARRAGD